MPRPFHPKIVSANDLFAGDVVYFTTDGEWTRDIAEAHVARTKDDAQVLLQRADLPGRVVGPVLIDVIWNDAGQPEPLHFRERFREFGPSHRDDLKRKTDTSLPKHRTAA